MSATVASSDTNGERGSRCTAPVTPSPRMNPATTNTAVSDTNVRRARPGQERAQHQQASEGQRGHLEAVRHGADEPWDCRVDHGHEG